MRPVFVCQLPDEQQREIKNMLEGLILHGCGGDHTEVERHYGMSLKEAVQNGIDSKILDLDYLMVFYAEEYKTEKANEKFRLADAAVISSILREARKHDTLYPFVEMSEQEDGWER